VQTVVPEAEFHTVARAISYRQRDVTPGRGTILIAAAGTSDLPVAEEACVAAEVIKPSIGSVNMPASIACFSHA
jgi:NCAIR mutase (PurE)-related protein